ncbi:hypothetical protein DVA86_02460 [Streptomyces armeniacus]|uniref:Integral membrane protein n=1 Tax=Streptomyces armeniacus TaxID=83291 RepID=A0A345XJ63_9ACTN|nr:hypothetical protein [Streptomyces armeniacus]AXK31679.1 hypothetical protein DVA86_02460 [Streptomyces armeniacus]
MPSSPLRRLRLAAQALAQWSAARRATAAVAAAATALAVGLPTALIPSPVFGREIAPEWWSYPVLAATALLAGVVLTTYVRRPAVPDGPQRVSRLGAAGGVLSFLAVGCPVCNKLVLIALGTSGALSYWAPLQPLIGAASLALLAVAAVRRLAGEVACPADGTPRASTTAPTN